MTGAYKHEAMPKVFIIVINILKSVIKFGGLGKWAEYRIHRTGAVLDGFVMT